MSKWRVAADRAYWRLLLPLPCSRCGRVVTGAERWQVDHVVERARGGAGGRENQWPAHAVCNEGAGGRLAAARRRTVRDAEKNVRQWI